jgi:biopolymer transport protein ExbB/TolQ
MFGTVRIIAILIIVIIVVASLWYVTSMREQLAISKQNNEKLNQAVVMQQELIEQVKKDVGLIQEANKELSSTIQAQNKDLNSLQSRFNTNADGSSRDIGQLATTNTKSIERAVNRGSRNAVRCLEIASGAPLTVEERTAKTASEINRECPSIANPNYKPN